MTTVRSLGSPVPVRTAVALVSAGGAIGATARWAIGWTFPSQPPEFPWATFAINVSGSLLLALLPAITVARDPRRGGYLVPFLGPGLLGGFTTLSATSEEGRALVAAGHSTVAAAYLLGTLAAALLAVWVAGRLVRTQGRRR